MIADLKELKHLLQLCRKLGVSEIEFDNVKLKMGEAPAEESQSANLADGSSENKWANFPEGELTPEQLAFYSAGGLPENDPFREAQ